MRRTCLGVLSVAILIGSLVMSPGRPASAQAVGFGPVIGSFPDGVSMPVTPVATHDRRYVRMTLQPQFTGLLGFDTATVPAAVSGAGVQGNIGLPQVNGFGVNGGTWGVNSAGYGVNLNGFGAYNGGYGNGYGNVWVGGGSYGVPWGGSYGPGMVGPYGPRGLHPAQTVNGLGALGAGIQQSTRGWGR